MKALLVDWRVATLVILVLLSVIAIYPHFDENGNLASNLQYGLDLQQGAWIQLEMKGEVVGFTTNQPVDVFVANLTKQLGTEVVVVDENHLEIRKIFSQAELEPVVAANGGKITSYRRESPRQLPMMSNLSLKTRSILLVPRMPKLTS